MNHKFIFYRQTLSMQQDTLVLATLGKIVEKEREREGEREKLAR
jgi:hypothetical protein